jgi:hypothetical protein
MRPARPATEVQMTKRLRSKLRPDDPPPGPQDAVWKSFPPLPADHPLFKAGWVIGQRRPPAAAPPKPKGEEG